MPKPLAEIIGALVTSPHGFMLKGSRLIGGARQNSDWDFVVKNSDAASVFLQNLGFVRFLDLAGGETMNYATEHRDSPNVPGEVVNMLRYRTLDNVEVQVVLSEIPEVHLQAAHIVKAFLFERHLNMPKQYRRYIWGPLMQALTYRAPQPEIDIDPF